MKYPTLYWVYFDAINCILGVQILLNIYVLMIHIGLWFCWRLMHVSFSCTKTPTE